MDAMWRTVRLGGEDRVDALWCGEWQVTFSTDGGDPRIERGAPSADAVPVPEPNVERTPRRVNVAANGWVVGFGDGKPLLLPPKPRVISGGATRRYRIRSTRVFRSPPTK